VKIAVLAPPEIPIPLGDSYGGIELIAQDFAMALTEMDHFVDLYCTPSQVSWMSLMGESKRWPVSSPYPQGPIRGDYDFIFDFTHQKQLAKFYTREKYAATCFHTDQLSSVRDIFPTKAVRSAFGVNGPQIYPGIKNVYRYREEKEKFLLFLGRIAPYKRPDIAILLARMTNRPLILAGHVGKFSEWPLSGYADIIQKDVDERPNAQLIRNPTLEEKVDLLSRAAALVVPSDWSSIGSMESFGIVAVEALMCFPKDTEIDVPSPILEALEREYYGRLVYIETETGRSLTTTPNHPVLTQCGWLRSESLTVGDSVVIEDGKEKIMDRGGIGEVVRNLHDTDGEGHRYRDGMVGGTDQEKGARPRAPQVTPAVYPTHKRAGGLSGADGPGVSGWDSGWRGDGHSQTLSPGAWQAHDLHPNHYNLEHLRSPGRMAGRTSVSSKLLHSPSPRWASRDDPLLRLQYQGLLSRLSALEVIGARSHSQVRSGQGVTRLHGGKVERPPSLRNGPGSRGGLRALRKMAKFERVKKVAKASSARSLRVYNLRTQRGYYYANGIIVHNSGTPVITSGDGGLKEIVAPTANCGFVCRTIPEYVDAVKRLGKISPKDCLARGDYFSAKRMAIDYLRLIGEATSF